MAIQKTRTGEQCILNISVPVDVYKRIIKESESLGLSRSAYLTMTLKQKWQQDELTANLPQVMEVFSRILDKMDAQEKEKKRK